MFVLGKVRPQVFSLKQVVKILLLGAGKSIKPTFLKPTQIIHGQDFKECPWGLLPHCLSTMTKKGMKVLADFKRSSIFYLFVFVLVFFLGR